MRPIEPGCMCLSLCSVHRGSCIAIRALPAGTVLNAAEGGTVRTIHDGWSCEFEGYDFPAAIATKDLIRIDGHEPVTSEEGMEVSA